ncbi:MAG TPA: RNA polymerase sigma factor [Aliidongia sp.]|nr:RNA polymerase sigma factor [Aliidongia sp.]
MIDAGRALLRHLLVAGYEDLKRRLTRRLGSADLAVEALHETYLRLDGAAELGAVRQPASYLYRTALNAAADRHRADMRWAGRAELEALLHTDEEALDPERIVAAKSEIASLERVLAELPSRRRGIFIAALVEEQPYRMIAARFGISIRSVEREVGLALDHCGRRLEKKLQKRAGRPR